MILNADFFFGIIIILIGFAIETIGWKIHQQIVGVSGFIIGLVVGDFVGSQLLQLNFSIWRGVILVIFSVIFTLLFFIYMRISISVTSGIIGALIISGFTSSQTITGWNLDYAVFRTNFNYPSLLIAFVISCYAGYRFYKIGYIIISTGIGSILVAYGGIISGLWTYSYLGIFLLLSLLFGAIVQLAQEGAIQERRLAAQAFRYCTTCGNLIISDGSICLKCGNKLNSD